MMLQDRADGKVRGAQVEVNTGRKWKEDKAVNDTESVSTASTAEKMRIVQGDVQSTKEETRQAAAVGMKKTVEMGRGPTKKYVLE
ncbi:hypothetical protein DPMN_025235 [Dreissena polymorpha]|uniref:Uncharacterized protein n=1 Tax=Dreissena polymorpha TaxID=45954 RepID=A0A9D4LR16_DREPO|nr:hypothetical protein DPMN_025235 [Dreissena polymorpha]